MRSAISAPTPEHFHEWRKQVKYLRHQMEIVSPVWPEVVGGLATSLSHLGDVLGDDHDQSELVRLVASLPDLMPDPDERNLLVALSQQRRRELAGAAVVMGKRIYAESAGPIRDAGSRPIGRLGGCDASKSRLEPPSEQSEKASLEHSSMEPIPDPALVVLVGPSGSGKTTWANENFRPEEIISSDRLRAIVGSGEHDLDASADAFSILDQMVAGPPATPPAHGRRHARVR